MISELSKVNVQSFCQQPFRAGNIKNFLSAWRELTSDKHILSIVQGCTLEFEQFPCQNKPHKPCHFSESEILVLNTEIQKLLDKAVIVECEHEPFEYFSNIFLRPKKNNSFRTILNLKHLNKLIVYRHFKMDNLSSALNLVSPNCFMGSIDLSDAYYSVPVHPNYQKFLKFTHNGKIYKFTCLPNGLTSAPRIFTKLLKPVLASLRAQGFLSTAYLDDLLLVGHSYQQCYTNIQASLDLFKSLGFTINLEKSVIIPTHTLQHLGFVIDSVNMLVSLPKDKVDNLVTWCKFLLDSRWHKIHIVAKVLGFLVAYLPAVECGKLFYRQLEKDKILALARNKGNFDATMAISKESRRLLDWWIHYASTNHNPISHGNPHFTIQTDASNQGWGAKLLAQQGNSCMGGRWMGLDRFQHINYLELKAAFQGIKSLCKNRHNSHILIEMDNTTAVAYINNMGGSRSSLCNSLAQDIWHWCLDKRIWLSATHIAGASNVDADRESRTFNDKTEWKLCPKTFKNIVARWQFPEVDMFASHLNYQFKPFVAWRPDPEAVAINAFTLSWHRKFIYAFPPFSLIGRVLSKLKQDQGKAILIVPDWKTQIWYPLLGQMMIDSPIYLSKSKRLLRLPFDDNRIHPMWPKLQMMACLVDGAI